MLRVTGFICLLKRGNRIAFGGEFLSHIAIITRRLHGWHDRRIVEFLVLIQLMSAGHTGSVEMPDVLDIRMYGGNYIALKDLLIEPVWNGYHSILVVRQEGHHLIASIAEGVWDLGL